ncbi:hypothetical protein [Methylobacterium frigidaeris]|uniref:hypothetical protein n=1 Tax=Methylobacterium frigidaeris TaxID=2038277 RepID=UPI001EDF0D98|nr:hypothetical protein [Methylobacterium frigidaeris]
MLASALAADLIPMDDRDGVQGARARGFAVTGTLGLLSLAARRGLLDLPDAIARLRATKLPPIPLGRSIGATSLGERHQELNLHSSTNKHEPGGRLV